jgi:hypothetical protein
VQVLDLGVALRNSLDLDLIAYNDQSVNDGRLSISPSPPYRYLPVVSLPVDDDEMTD